MPRTLPFRAGAAALALVLGITSSPLRAGDLNAEVNNMFNNLGAVGNYTAPGAFRGQTFNTYTGGSLMMRTPNKVYQLAAIEFPSAKAGCGGIDVFGGSFSHISATEFKNMLRNITAALPGIAFQLALEAVSPLLGGLSKWAKGLETWINNARINSCETAKAIVSTAADAVGYSSQETCADLAVDMGLETDRDAARRRCATDRPSILASARSSGDAKVRNKAPFVGNLTWKALQSTGAYLDDQERELIMSMVGTVIFYPEDQNRDPQPIAPTLTSISRLLYGQSAATGSDVVQHMLRCNDYTRCDVVTLNTSYTHTPFTARVETLMRSIADKIATRTAIPNNSAEVGFVNQTTEPVYKMLSIGATIPGSGLADSLISQYRDVIAADYAYVFLERNLRLGMAALDKDYTLQQVQREQANHVRQRAQAMLQQLSQEKSLLYQKVGSFRAVSSHLEQLERQLRSSMPQHVMDMLGQQAAYLSRVTAPSAAMWEIYAYQNSDSLFGVFNAAAAIHASNDYMSAVAAVAFCGFVAALIAYAFAPEKLQGWKWLGTVVLVFSVLIVPKVTVGIVDKTGGSAVKVVDNVPFGVAVLGSITSTVGNTLTGLFETAFQVIPGPGALPAELAYQQNGLMFGNRLIREAGNVVFQDPGFRTDLINFIHNCTTYDLVDGTLDPATFSTSDNVWPLMGSPNPARFSTLTTGGGVSVATCPNVYSSLDGRLPAQLTRIQGQLALQLNPTLPAAAAGAVIAGQIQQAYLKNNIASAASTAADLIRQNAVLNAIEDTGKIVGQKVNDPAAMVLAVGRAQAVAQQNASWINAGKVAEQALPVLRNVVEAITYAVFPLFVLLLLLTSGRETMMAFKGYAAILIWIQLWPPLYAILNYMASIYASYDLAAAANLGTGAKALALQTTSTIYSRAISGEAVVGYMAISVPFIAWAALKRMETMGTALVGGLSGLQGTLAGATGGAAAGNVSMGNVGMDQMQLAPNRTSAFMGSQQNDLSGNTFSSNALTGRTAVSLLRNQGFASRVVSMRVSEQDVTEASRSAETARSEAVSASEQRSATLTEAFSRGVSKLRSTRNTTGTTSSSFEQLGESLTKLDQIAQSVSERTGLSQSQVAHIAFGANASLGLSTPVASARVQGSAGKNYQSGILSDEQKVLNTMTTEQLAAFKQFGDRISRDSSVMNLIASDSREAREMSSRLATTTTQAERAEAVFAQRRGLAERMSAARERGETMSIDIAQDPHNLAMFMRYAEQYGGDSAAAHTMMESELARQGLRPTRALSDGTALPSSFGDVREAYDKERTGGALSSTVNSARQANDARVAGERPAPATGTPRKEGPSPIRAEVQAAHAHLQGRAGEAVSGFDAKAEIVKTPDGTLKSGKSLAVQTGKQVAADTDVTLDAAKDAVRKVMKQDK